ncbi:MAG: YfhO family protein [Lachnospiraceae bacterium]|nr:YfhO family protein [Lachnospiraceae bacterium]
MTDIKKNPAKDKKQISFTPFISPLISFFFGSILFAVLLSINGFLFPGGGSMCNGDNFDQYIAFIESFMRVLKGEQDFWYSFSLYAGAGSVLTYTYYTLSPLNLLYLVPFISIITATHVIAAIKTGLAAAAFSFYSEHTLKTKRLSSVFFSLCYAFCSWAVVMSMNCMWADSLYVLPILIALISDFITLSTKKRFLSLTICYAYLFITNFYMGYIIGIFSALAFIAITICAEEWSSGSSAIKGHITSILKKTVLFISAVLLAAALCAALLVPTAYFLINHLKGYSDSFITLSASIPDIFSSLYACGAQGLYSSTPYIYCGLPVLLLVPFYFFTDRVSFMNKVCTAGLLVFYFCGTIIMPLYQALHAFDNPNHYSFRFSPCIVFILVSMAARVWAENVIIKNKTLWILIASLVAVYSFLVIFNDITGIAPVSDTYLVINAIFMFLWGIIYTQSRKSSANSLKANRYAKVLPFAAMAILALELLISGSVSFRSFAGKSADNGPRTDSDTFDFWYGEESAAVKDLHVRDNGFYRIRVDGEKCFNGASLFGTNTLTSFASFEEAAQRNVFASLGIGNSYHMLFDISGTSPVDMLFSVKYDIDIPDSPENGHASINENKRALPIAYTVSSDLAYYRSGTNPFDNTNNLLSCMTGQDISVYEQIPANTIKTESFNTHVYELGNDTAFDMMTDSVNLGWVTYDIPVSGNKTAYAFFTPLNGTYFNSPAPYIVRNSNVGFNCDLTIAAGAIYEAVADSLSAESNDPNDYSHLTLYINTSGYRSYAVGDISFAYYDDSALTDAYNILAPGGMQVTSYTDTRIEGTVDVTEDKPLLFTSIPYDKGWSAYVDGSPSKIYVTLDDTFCTLALAPGKHNVVFIYTPPYAFAGSVISSIAIIVFLAIFISSGVTKKATADPNKADSKDSAPVTSDTSDGEK